jgi:hypothetical protein
VAQNSIFTKSYISELMCDTSVYLVLCPHGYLLYSLRAGKKDVRKPRNAPCIDRFYFLSTLSTDAVTSSSIYGRLVL